MKKLLTFSFLLAVLLTTSFRGFSQAFKQGSKFLNATVGLNSYYSTGLPLGASFEVGITDAISVGGQADYASGNYGSGLGFTAFYVGARGAYHLGEILKINSDKVDVYAGLGLGYRSFSWKDGYNGIGLILSHPADLWAFAPTPFHKNVFPQSKHGRYLAKHPPQSRRRKHYSHP